MPVSSSSLISIQILRGIAALFVVFYHVYLIGADNNYLGVKVFEDFSQPGKLGVNLFFVLSGFIICFAHSSDFGKSDRILSYIKKRVIRIYPPYWVFSAFYIAAAYAGLGYADFEWSFSNLFSSFALFQFNQELSLPLKVGWTLFYEMLFYFIFIAVFFSAKMTAVLFMIWAAVLAFLAIRGVDTDYRLLASWNLNFLAGCAAYYIYSRSSKPIAYPSVLVGLLGIAYGIYSADFDSSPLSQSNVISMFSLAIGFGALVLGLALLDRFFTSARGGFFAMLGDASYSIYLVHSAAVSLFYIVAKRIGIYAVGGEILYALCVVFALSVGILAYFVCERPMLKYIKRFASRGKYAFT